MSTTLSRARGEGLVLEVGAADLGLYWVKLWDSSLAEPTLEEFTNFWTASFRFQELCAQEGLVEVLV